MFKMSWSFVHPLSLQWCYRRDTLAVEIMNGHLYIVLQYGDVHRRKKLADVKVNDGLMHSLVIEFRHWDATAMVKVYYNQKLCSLYI